MHDVGRKSIRTFLVVRNIGQYDLLITGPFPKYKKNHHVLVAVHEKKIQAHGFFQ